MPAETFSWQPMEGVATVASAYMHIARYNYQLPHLNMGEKPYLRTSRVSGYWAYQPNQKAR